MLLNQKYLLLISVVVAGMGLLVTCSKDKVPLPVLPPEPTKWEKIAGHYKVYDTMGVYLYDMDLVHSYNESLNKNFIMWVNFDGEFTFTTVQVDNSLNIPMKVYVGGGDTLYDPNNKRWKLWGGNYAEYNIWNNDTIPLRFTKTNINYYIEDVTPYYSCDCKQIAVKQH